MQDKTRMDEAKQNDPKKETTNKVDNALAAFDTLRECVDQVFVGNSSGFSGRNLYDCAVLVRDLRYVVFEDDGNVKLVIWDKQRCGGPSLNLVVDAVPMCDDNEIPF